MDNFDFPFIYLKLIEFSIPLQQVPLTQCGEEKSETFNDNLLLFESFFGGRYASIIFVSTWRHTYLKMKKRVWSKELIHMRVHRLAFISFCYVPNTWVGFKFWCLTFLCVLVSTMPRQNCATTYFKKSTQSTIFFE